MNINDALSIVRQACAVFKGTLEDHNKIQEAIKTLALALLEPGTSAAEELAKHEKRSKTNASS